MKHIARTVESRPGLTQEQALTSLQDHPQFKAGTKIKSIRQHGDRWLANLLEPKTAEFPPKDDEESDDDAPEIEVVEEGPDDSDDSSEDSDGDGDSGPPKPPFGKEDGPEGPGDEGDGPKGELGEVLQLLHQVVEALGIGSPDGLPGVDEAFSDGPPGPGVPPPHKGPGRPPGPGGAPPGPKPGGPAARPVRDVPPGANPMAGFASRVPSFTATTEDNISIKEAKADLEQSFEGYQVKQIRRVGGKLHALLSNR